MHANTLKKLRDALGLGLGTVTRVWESEAKDWVTSVFAADVDGDGEGEVVACSRDGRVHLISSEGIKQWERVIGTKSWVGSVVARNVSLSERENSAHIVAGTRSGRVYVLDKDGNTITRNGDVVPSSVQENDADPNKEQPLYWYDGGQVIRQVTLTSFQPSQIVIGSDDHCAYGLDDQTGEVLWNFQTKGGVRTVRSYRNKLNVQVRILVGSVDGYLYLLDEHGQMIDKYLVGHPVHTVVVAHVDDNGCAYILVASDDKDLICLTYVEGKELTAVENGFEQKWRRSFHHRFNSLCVIDIDNDGKLEIIAGSEDKHIYILDFSGNTIWRHNHKYRVFSIYPYDIDKDGLPELLMGTEHNRVRAMRVRLYKGLEQRIRRYHRALEEPNLTAIRELTTDERALLLDILQMEEQELVTTQQARQLIEAGSYDKALSTLLKLKQQHLEQLWLKDTIGHVRALCLRCTVSDSKKEIIVGTSGSGIHVFNCNGRRIGFSSLDEHIIDVQVGGVDHNKWEAILACSSEHHVYALSGAKKMKVYTPFLKDAFVSSMCMVAQNAQGTSEAIIGSTDKKLYIFGSDLQKPIRTVSTLEVAKIVRSCPPSKERFPEIVVAGMEKRVYAHVKSKEVWDYHVFDPIRSLCMKDINGDGKVEVLIGSEDRNIYVLDNTGHLLWRYYLPHSVLAIDAAPIHHDGSFEILVGCADGNLYAFSEDGTPLWTYQARDRIHALCVDDIDDDGNIEIVLGSEGELELLRIVNQRQIELQIAQCWAALCQQLGEREVIDRLLHSDDPFLQAFALSKLVEQEKIVLDDHDFEMLGEFVQSGDVGVRKALIRVAMMLYPVSAARAQSLLSSLWGDSEPEMRNAFIEHIHILMSHNWELGFAYLQSAFESPDRFVKRMVIRKLHQLLDTPIESLIDTSIERPIDWHQDIFRLLLAAAQEKISEWVRQEAARTLAHFLDRYHENLVVYIHLFIVKGVQIPILRHIAYATTTPVVKQFINAVIPMLEGLSEQNALERLQQVVEALEEASNFIYGKALWLIYTELHHLFSLETMERIANYQCALRDNQFDPDNKFAFLVLDIFNQLSFISRPLKMYLRRHDVQDRMTSLHETIEAIDRMFPYIEQKYSTFLMDEAITRLPDRHVFFLLLTKWRTLVYAQLNALRGKPELRAELQTKDVPDDEQIGIWLAVKNVGRSSASNVKITLLHSESFEIVGRNSFDNELLLPQEEMICEFVLEPFSTMLNFRFEMTYDDAESQTQIEEFEESLHLRAFRQEFRDIPNFYSSGIPTYDSRMFYGREEDIIFLQDILTKSVKNVVVLYGQRRSGKTTLLVQLCNSSVLGDAIPVLIDLQGMAYEMTSIGNLLYSIAYTIVKTMKEKGISISPLQETDFATNPTHTFTVFLDQLEGQLAGRKLILLIDEFEVLEEQVTKKNLRPEIFEYLRGIVQHKQYMNFLFSGTHRITDYTKWYRSVFFHIARHHRISRLSVQGAEDLILKPTEAFLEYEPHTLTKIHALTGDQPYLIHLICGAIVEYCNDRRKNFVTINDVNAVLREVMVTGNYHFDWLWDQIKPEVRVTLAVLAEGGREEGRWLTFSEIEEIYRHYHIPYKREYILDALKTLSEADIIEESPDDIQKTGAGSKRYKIPVGLIRNWLLKEHPLTSVIGEMRD